MNFNDNIYVAGHLGMVGSAIIRELQKQGYQNIITKTRKELDLTNQNAVDNFFSSHPIDYVFIASAKVGGIYANKTQPAEFIYQNLQIQNNIIHQSYLNNIKRLIFLGSSCIYPRDCPQPIREEYLLTGQLESTNYAYATAKIAGVKMCQAYREQYDCDFVAVMPTNLYGINDNFDLTTSHVLPALLRKFDEAKVNNQSSVVVWGTGKPSRELLYVDDLAKACIFIINNNNIKELINIGTGIDISIFDLAYLVKKITGFSGEIIFDQTKPDGTPRKLLDVSKINNFGWRAMTELEDGIREVYEWYVKEKK